MKNYDFDVIISTITLKEPEDLWIKVSPMLEDEDILRLQKLFMDIKRNKKKLGTPNQLRLPAPGIRTDPAGRKYPAGCLLHGLEGGYTESRGASSGGRKHRHPLHRCHDPVL